MKKSVAIVLVSGLAGVCAAAPALGADLAPREYAKAPPVIAPSPAYDWSGFYIGANIGGTWDSSSSTNSALDGTFVSSGSSLATAA